MPNVRAFRSAGKVVMIRLYCLFERQAAGMHKAPLCLNP